MSRTGPHLRVVASTVAEPESAAGEEAAEQLTIDAVYRRHAPYVATVGLRILGRPDEVEDLVQDVFLAARRTLRTVRDPRSIQSWLATIAVRVAKKRLVKRDRWRLLGLRATPEQLGLVAAASPEDAALISAVYRALDALRPDLRIAWVLRYVEGERLEGVARLCGCSLATAKRRIAAAHAAVREAVGDG